ncbi:sugar ABC transporter ATP-binding protein [Thermus thermophilus]|uniref:sugar ABC transporter ATP-binding protein n=1 Tax=Thermus thermophilus TaxID=274 RepID=UPI001FCA8035|nr:sugar ABC transporter ATP-binding protein [Thermus thermophilus]BDG30012.1 ribose import ATP-binding protein RbsA [Thermus thermophilus]
MALLEMRGIRKRFGGVEALKGVDFAVEAGEIHALVGENGAGKSTLMKILSGALAPDGGEVWLSGRRLRLGSVQEARRQGIAMVYQELNLAPNLSVAENLFLGRLPPFVDRKRLYTRARILLEELDLGFTPEVPVGALEVGQQTLVAVAQALSQEARILVFDEATAALSAREAERLFQLVKELRNRGLGIVWISHRLEEVFHLADRVTVLRDGQRVATLPLSGLKPEALVELMVGKREAGRLDLPSPKAHPPLHLEVRGGGLEPLAFDLRPGEILGLAGVVGSGRSAVVEILFGLEGEGRVNGEPLRSPLEAIRRGVFLVPADRKAQGLILGLSARANIGLPVLRELSFGGVVSASREAALARQWFQALGIRPQDPERPAGTFSGGNQQKLVLAKALATRPRLLLLAEPTRGVDVAARQEIYALLATWAREGVAQIVSSGDTEELLLLCHRIFVFRKGRVVAEFHPPYCREEVVAHVVGAAQA